MQTAKKMLNLFVRILTIPPIVTGITVLLLYRPANVLRYRECLCSLLFLTILPLLAYPFSVFGKKSIPIRERQRSLALILSLVGYAAGFLWSFLMQTSGMAKVLFSSYLLSAIILIVLNKLHFRASGHACSATAPAVFLTRSLGWYVCIPCLPLFIVIYASSISLRRHSFWQLAVGSMISAVSGMISIWMFC